MASARSLQDVALTTLLALKERKAFKQTEIAKRLKTADAAVSETLSGKRKITLRFLQAVSEVTGIHPGELLVDPHRDQVKVINPIEMQMLRYFRSWPVPTREALLSFASFFADEDPVTADERRAHEQLRRLKSDAVRRRALAYLTFLSEGGLTPDLQEAFGLLDSGETQSPADAKPKRKTRTPPTKTRA